MCFVDELPQFGRPDGPGWSPVFGHVWRSAEDHVVAVFGLDDLVDFYFAGVLVNVLDVFGLDGSSFFVFAAFDLFHVTGAVGGDADACVWEHYPAPSAFWVVDGVLVVLSFDDFGVEWSVCDVLAAGLGVDDGVVAGPEYEDQDDGCEDYDCDDAYDHVTPALSCMSSDFVLYLWCHDCSLVQI